MKAFLTLTLIFAAAILAGPKALAVTPIYGANLNGVLSTEIVNSNTTSRFVTTVVNNATVINALFKTGTSGVTKASNMAVVYAPTGGIGLAVINTSTRAVLYNLAVSGTQQIQSSIILAPTRNVFYYTFNLSDIEFTIPSVTGANPPVFTGPIFTNWVLRETVISPSTTPTPLAATVIFTGGSGSGATNSTYFRGSIALNGRKY